jgi:hypothetical protein
MPAGWMNERVNMSDWLEPVGEIFDGTCWCEVSNMLTYVELPGLYIQTDKGLVCAIDHVEAKIVEDSEEKLIIQIANPTKFDAVVKLFSENSTQAASIMGQNALWSCERVHVKANASVVVEIKK